MPSLRQRSASPFCPAEVNIMIMALESWGLALIRFASSKPFMPGMDGFELAKRIKANPQLSSAIIMMLTSAGQNGDAERCRRLGIVVYLIKPIRKSELLSAILAALGPRSAHSVPDLVTRHSLRETTRNLRILVAEDNPVNQK